MKSWNKIKDIILQLRGLTTIGVADIGSNAISAIFWLYMAAVLGASHYGEISYFLAIASIASTVSMTGAANTLMVYTAKNVKIEPPVYFISIIAALIISIGIFLSFHNLGLSVYILGAVLFVLGTSEMLGKKLYMSYTKFLITQKILMVMFAIGLYYVVGINGVILGIGLSFFHYTIRIFDGFRRSRLDFKLVRSRFGFMMNNYLLNLSSAFSGSIDKLIIAPILGFTLLGNYQLGIQFLAVLQILPSIIFKYILPQDASGNSNKKLKKMTIFISFCLAVLGFSFSPQLVPFLFPKYMEAIPVIQIMSLSIIPLSVNTVYQSKFLGGEKSTVILISAGIYLAVQIVSIVLLGKIFGLNGVAAAFVLATSAESMYYLAVDRLTKATN